MSDVYFDHDYCVKLDFPQQCTAFDHTYSKSNNLSKNETNLKKILFWNVGGKSRLFSALNVDVGRSFFDDFDVICFSETWSTSPSSSIRAKDLFASNATPTSGRPSGGLELYCSPLDKGIILSKSSSHICVKLSTVILINVYFKPSLDFDQKVSDLIVALSACDQYPSLSVVLGGDFNIHSNSYDFENLREILGRYGLSLCSDPSIPTFLGNVGSATTPDHLFCSSSIPVKRFYVPSRVESDHQPLVVEVAIPNESSSRTQKTKLDKESCRLELNSINATRLGSDVIANKITDALIRCQNISKERSNYNHNIKMLKKETTNAFKLYQRHKSDFFKSVYVTCRKKLHREIVLNKRNIKERNVANLIQATSQNGIKSLYSAAKPISSSHSSQVPLHEWYKYYSELYQSFDEPSFKAVNVVPDDSAVNLLRPFDEGEIIKAIMHQNSSAKGFNGTSPVDMKEIVHELAPLLVPIFNDILNSKLEFPKKWSTSIFFFLYKKGTYNDPANYRSLAIEDPLLKIFTTALYIRLTDHCEAKHLLPEYQFAFRKNRSTISATSILKECVNNALKNRRRIFACFVDYKKAFDLVNREQLCEKLQKLGMPTAFAKIIFDLLANISFRVRSNDSISPPFESFNGVPQGDPLSPLLFSLFTSDLPSYLKHPGVPLGFTRIRYLLYVDDLVRLCNSATELQFAIDCLQKYADLSFLSVNITKTKCMIFFRGSCPRYVFKFKGFELETCNNFTYLGVVFTTRLSASKHVEYIVSKCNSKIGFLFSKLPIKEIPINVALELFNVYILPIITYALPIWFPSIAEGSKKKINSMLTKFIKRFLGLPYSANNAFVHYLTSTIPLSLYLSTKLENATLNIKYPSLLNGFQVEIPSLHDYTYNPIPSIPTFLWLSPPLTKPLPARPEPRRALLYDVMDLVHSHICKTNAFHLEPDEDTCVCRFCNDRAHHYHHKECPHLKYLSPCALLQKVFVVKEQI